jgi:predicted MPP superfamily phosphohydrolase
MNVSGFLSAAEIDRILENRLGPVHARQRLGIEKDHEARAFRRTIRTRQDDDQSLPNVAIGTILRLSGTYRRGRANAARIGLRHNDVVSARLAAPFDGFTILHLSDLHADMSAEAMAHAATMVSGLHYDLCVLTGDYRGRTYGPFQLSLGNMLRLCGSLRGEVYGVLGNHDSIRMVPDLERMGIRMLLNEHVEIERGGSRIVLAGIDDAHFYRLDNIEKAAAGVHGDAFSILLSHTPEVFRRASHAGFDLLLAGHTHGGQICLPGGVPIILQSRLPRAMGRGAWRYHDMSGYTSAGTGACGVPVRFNCPPEIALHRLRCIR